MEDLSFTPLHGQLSVKRSKVALQHNNKTSFYAKRSVMASSYQEKLIGKKKINHGAIGEDRES